MALPREWNTTSGRTDEKQEARLARPYIPELTFSSAGAHGAGGPTALILNLK
jgi:hypothetical protein